MGLFRRSPRELPLPFPRLDGSTWPDRRTSGVGSFAAATLYEMGQREALTPPAHDLTDLLADELLPLLDLRVSPEDEPHLRRVCTVAVQVGAGIGLVEQRGAAGDGGGTLSRDVAGALWLAAEDLPAMGDHQRDVARYLLQCGYFLARTGRANVLDLAVALRQEEHPAARPAR